MSATTIERLIYFLDHCENCHGYIEFLEQLGAEIDRLTAELEAARKNHAESVQEWKNWHLQVNDALQCKFLSRGVTLESAKKLTAEFESVMAENKALKEAVRWRVWPDEKPDTNQGIVCDNECWVYLGDGRIQSQSGDLYEFNLSDTWLPIPAKGDET